MCKGHLQNSGFPDGSFQLLNSLLSGRDDLFRRTTCWRIATGRCWGSCAAVWIAPSTTWSCCHTFAFPFLLVGPPHGRKSSGPRMTSYQPSGTVHATTALQRHKKQKKFLCTTETLERKWLGCCSCSTLCPNTLVTWFSVGMSEPLHMWLMGAELAILSNLSHARGRMLARFQTLVLPHGLGCKNGSTTRQHTLPQPHVAS